MQKKKIVMATVVLFLFIVPCALAMDKTSEERGRIHCNNEHFTEV
ncbi:hypothetical protein ACFLYW_03940 [Thermodesulfobacteriota bacterium]